LKEILNLKCDGTWSRPGDANQRRIVVRYTLRVEALLKLFRLLGRIRGDWLSNQLYGLLQSYRRVPTRVSHFHAKRYVPQQIRIPIYFIDRLENDLDSLDSVMLANLRRGRRVKREFLAYSCHFTFSLSFNRKTGGFACKMIIDTMQIESDLETMANFCQQSW
jgi:hypothetical protein